ncbi:MAG TPA: transferrin-binding protein-like solute binding protein, partial [Sphingomonadaceae bacterium]|nr:transferrin-binding protein-like solute binding protein [Sphingomonadaceae bacterium]
MGAPAVSATFTAIANAAQVSYDVGRAKPATGGAVTGAKLAYDAGTDSFTLSAGEKTIVFTPADLTIKAGNQYRYEKTAGGLSSRFDLNWGLRSEWESAPAYVALGQYISRQREVATGIDSYNSIDFVYGLPSEKSAIPRSGRAAYALSFLGTRSSGATEYLLEMMGRGAALINFDTGQLEISGKTSSFNFLGPGILNVESDGVVKGSGALTAGQNSFTGTFTAKAGASDTYSGNFTGSFYGPHTEDIGGAFYGTSGSHYYSLAFTGYGLPTTAAGDTLANLRGTTRFRTVSAAFDFPASEFVNNPLGEEVIYDASSGTYKVMGSGYSVGAMISFGAANRTPDKDAGDFRYYGVPVATADGKLQYAVGLFDGASAGIELTYASFMRIAGKYTDLSGKTKAEGVEYVGFGSFTPPDQLPQSGSATYAGRIFGDLHDDTNLIATLTGRSDLSVNFASGALSSSLFIERVGAGGSSTAMGRYDFTGSLDSFTASFAAARNTGQGTLVGRFYGDAAQEYAAVFNITDPMAGELTGI